MAQQSIENSIVHNKLHTISYHRFAEKDLISENTWQNWAIKTNKLSNKTSWKEVSRILDELGFVHIRLQQYFNYTPVENGIVMLHCKNARAISFNGEIIPENYLIGNSIIGKEAALQKALSYFPAIHYYWQDSLQNAVLQYITGKKDTGFYPIGKLCYAPVDLNYLNLHPLCYSFDIYASSPLFAKRVFINAENGNLVAQTDLLMDVNSTGTAVTKYSGSQKIATDSISPTSFRLRETTRGNGIETYNLLKGTSYGSAVDFTDADNYWNNVNTNKDEVATDAHWGAEKTFDYYKTQHSRNSFDNSNAKIISYVHYSNNYDNAFWNGLYMTYGDGNSFKPLTSLDVCGHEVSHAVTTYTANLVYSYESGALNESFSDIFGNSIENYAKPSSWSWKIGEDITTSGNGIRNMSNPNLFNHPKYYKGNYWYSGTGDNGGVHTNSGVQNYWYFLITSGSTGTNEKGNNFKIDSLGFVKSGKIAYRTLSVYLTKNSQYSDARTYSIIAATDLFGPCSKEVINVTNAWWVCGVGNIYDSAYVKAQFKGDTQVCKTGVNVKFSNQSENFKRVKWFFGDGDTSNLSNPSHAYNAYGKFNVKLKAWGCFKNKLDSITITNYVKVDSTYDICDAVLMPSSGSLAVNKCKGFVYDDGGEAFYLPLRNTTLNVNAPGADSIRYRFLYLDYENGYDSIVLFKNNTTQAQKIGRFTGNVTPFAGAWKTIVGNQFWIKSYTDPAVEGKGFKIQFESFRPALSINAGVDSTICLGDSIVLVAKTNGGYSPDNYFIWNNGKTGNSIKVAPTANTLYSVKVIDMCTKISVSDSVNIFVRSPLKVTLNKDTVICSGKSVKLLAKATGGRSFTYNYKWSNIAGNVSNQTVTPVVGLNNYQVILSDGCTKKNDTAKVKIIVKPALKITLKPVDTIVCIGKQVTLTTKLSGGDTTKYLVNWNPSSLGTGTTKTITVTDTTKIIAILSDACSTNAAKDSITIFTFPALKLTKTADTSVCLGSNTTFTSNITGGKGSGYSYTWSTGNNTASIIKIFNSSLILKITASDACSPSITDSIKVSVLNPLSLGKITDTVLCDAQSYTINLTHTGGRSTSHAITWNPATVNGFNPSIKPSTIGKNTYIAVLNDACTSKNDTSIFNITLRPSLTAVFSATPNIICENDSTFLNILISGGKNKNYNWKIDGVSETRKNFWKKINSTQNINLDVTDGCSNPLFKSVMVTVNPKPTAKLTIDKKDICINDIISLEYSGNNIASAAWVFNNKDTLRNAFLIEDKTFNKTGKYAAKLLVKSAMGCTQLEKLADTISVFPYPIAKFKFVQNILQIENANAQITDLSVGAQNYFWNYGNGNYSTTAGTHTYLYTDTGKYNVTLIVESYPGCRDTFSDKIRIKDVYRVFIPTVFSPNGDNKNDVFEIHGTAIKQIQFSVYNRWGTKVFSTNNNIKSWDGKLSNGNYCINGNYILRAQIIDTEDKLHFIEQVLLLSR